MVIIHNEHLTFSYTNPFAQSPRIALLKNSVSIGLAAGKRVRQFDSSIGVKHVTVRSPTEEFNQYLRAQIRDATRTVMEQVMREELERFVGAAWGERSPQRKRVV